jgi:CRP-like cAMP-binding protein
LLLRRMPASDFALLAPHLQAFQADRGKLLFHAEVPVDYAFFLERGVGSLVSQSPEGQRAETGLFGREGFVPTALAMGDDRSPYEGTIQVPDDGYQIPAEAFRAALEASPALRLFLLKFAHVLAMQSAFTALSNAVHPIEERLARWILMCDDRSDSGELALTHEFMAIMLAVRRPSVTTALHVLEGNGFIRAERGLIMVRHREALETFAGDAYGKPEREYERLIGPLR